MERIACLKHVFTILLFAILNQSIGQDNCLNDLSPPKCIVENFTVKGSESNQGIEIHVPSVAFDECSDVMVIEYYLVSKGKELVARDHLSCGTHFVQGLVADQSQNLTLCEFYITVNCEFGLPDPLVDTPTKSKEGLQAKSEVLTQYLHSNFELGSLSAIWESGKRGPGAISKGNSDPGGISYGIYQLSSKQGYLEAFIHHEGKDYNEELNRHTPGTTSFNQAWKVIANADPEGFRTAQHNFIKRTHYDKYAVRVKNQIKLDINHYSKVMKDVFWSVAVQHGPYNNIFKNALSGQNLATLSESQIIELVYAERARMNENQLVNFPRVNERWKKNLIQRFESEKNVALNRLEAYSRMLDLVDLERTPEPLNLTPEEFDVDSLIEPGFQGLFAFSRIGAEQIDSTVEFSEEKIDKPEIILTSMDDPPAITDKGQDTKAGSIGFGGKYSQPSNITVDAENQEDLTIPAATVGMHKRAAFKILFVVLRNPKKVEFPELTDLGSVSTMYLEKPQITKYFIGEQESLESAQILLAKVIAAGFGGAKIVSDQSQDELVKY